MFPTVILLFFLYFNECSSIELTKISTRTSTIPGSGMDTGGWFSGGGSFSMRICQGNSCCETGNLNTEDDNWELGQVDWFVGRQIGQCNKFILNDSQSLTVRLQHSGSNAGLLDWIKLHSWDWAWHWVCPVHERLDYSMSYVAKCGKEVSYQTTEDDLRCNGRKEFCQLGIHQFLFPGTHNSGTGQKKGSFGCAFKNQDLTIEEQLEFGIRFFDLDVIDTDDLGCDGLETGHGKSPEFGLYQCFGKMSYLLSDMRMWLDQHPSEVVVLNFGNIEYPDVTVPSLVEGLASAFPAHSTSVTINVKYKQTGSWPTLAEAVTSNERIFVFIRDTVGVLSEHDLAFVKELKVKPTDANEPVKGPGEVIIMSSFLAEDVEGDCMYVLESNDLACQKDAELNPDFLKLSFFSTFGKSGTLGTECIHKMARKCNVWPQTVVEKCIHRAFRPNFILLDYPNYQSNSKITIVELCNEINYSRVKTLEEINRN